MMIVRDEQENLPRCLSSVAGLFDEIVVDTGSADRTREIAREFGARVFDFVWVNDVAAARNAELARATGDYAFLHDADDVLDPPQRAQLQAPLDGLRPGDAAAYVARSRSIRDRMVMAGRRWCTISGCFRCARACALTNAVH